ncbi:uncharacterized protein LOC136000822 [Caloenas nicobarica]|uniref:uncharacterized protein LOC136000822 n=1 Tax=Caloenas nicobarica TaxID=187106 RepID=UPI0032B7995D
MGTPGATRVLVTPEVSPALLEPLVAAVATLGEFGAIAGDIPVATSPGSLRAGLVALVATIGRAMGHQPCGATSLRSLLRTLGATGATGATTGDTWATTVTPGATEATVATTATPAATAALPPGDPDVPKAAPGATWAAVATITRRWREAVASAAATWATAAGDAERLRDAVVTVATAGATADVPKGHLAAAVAQEEAALRGLLAATRALPVATEVAAVASEVMSHGERVAQASAGLRAASEATEAAAVTAVAAGVARERGRCAAAAAGPLGRLVAACHGATGFYCHLQRLLEDVEAAVASGGPGEELVATVTAAETLWDASARLAKCHLLGTLRVARGLLVTGGVPDVTAVERGCRKARAAIPGLLRGQR